MTLEYHPEFQADFSAALAYYEAQGGWYLADRFEAEIRGCIAAIKAHPSRFPFYQSQPTFRRVRLGNFPYVIVYRSNPEVIRVLFLRHERRHPRFGTARQ